MSLQTGNQYLSNVNFGNSRPPPMYPFNNGPPPPPGSQVQIHPHQNQQPHYPFPHAHAPGNGGNWNGSNMPTQRLQPMFVNGNNGVGGGGALPPSRGLAPSPVPGNPSPPSSNYGISNSAQAPVVRDPVNIAPSPLAGALSGATLPNAPAVPIINGERRDSIGPHSQSHSHSTYSPDTAPMSIHGRAVGVQPLSRPSSAAAGSMAGSGSHRPSFSSSEVAPHFPGHIDGLAHKGMGLGPPSNLHDRVVFVSNVSSPLSLDCYRS
jgi:hypothetical protein